MSERNVSFVLCYLIIFDVFEGQLQLFNINLTSISSRKLNASKTLLALLFFCTAHYKSVKFELENEL